MKKGNFACYIAALIVTNPFSFRIEPYPHSQPTSITGKISPAEACETIWLIRAKDTLKTPVVWGNFSRQVKPGVYKLLVGANPPFKNVSIGNLEVKQNHVLDVGEIILE
jgi:hypothetical protein